jgi:hypothetical protein
MKKANMQSVDTKKAQQLGGSGANGVGKHAAAEGTRKAAPAQKMRFCMYHLQGVCKYTDQQCAFAHSTEEMMGTRGKGRSKGGAGAGPPMAVPMGGQDGGSKRAWMDQVRARKVMPGLTFNGFGDQRPRDQKKTSYGQATEFPPPPQAVGARGGRAGSAGLDARYLDCAPGGPGLLEMAHLQRLAAAAAMGPHGDAALQGSNPAHLAGLRELQRSVEPLSQALHGLQSSTHLAELWRLGQPGALGGLQAPHVPPHESLSPDEHTDKIKELQRSIESLSQAIGRLTNNGALEEDPQVASQAAILAGQYGQLINNTLVPQLAGLLHSASEEGVPAPRYPGAGSLQDPAMESAAMRGADLFSDKYAPRKIPFRPHAGRGLPEAIHSSSAYSPGNNGAGLEELLRRAGAPPGL